MAEAATENQEARADEKVKAPKPKLKSYLVENVVRRVGTRLHRARSATRHRFKIFIGNQRLLRNKKLPLTEEAFQKHKDLLEQLVLEGRVAITTPEGIRVTSLPDGRLVQRRLADGAVKVSDAAPAPKVPAEKKAEAPKEPAKKEEALKEATAPKEEAPKAKAEEAPKAESKDDAKKKSSKKSGRKGGE